MRFLNRVFVFVLLIAFFCCRHKSTDIGGKPAVVDPEDFLAMFTTLSLPVNFGDTSLSKKARDSAISQGIVSQFISDTVFQKNFGKTIKPKFYSAGKLVVKKGETYLFIKALTASKKVLYVICLDKDGKYQTGMPIVERNDDSEIRYATTIDNKYAISVSRLRKDGDGKTFFVRTVYVYNSDAGFMLIMRESNEGKPKTSQIYNPIDTLSHKHKFTGDYIQDKRNFISFRDGKNNNVLRFFVHFEKDNGNCRGELKGDVRFVSATTVRYTSSGDPCSLEFIFTDKNVRMKELEGCGNHRDIRCYFDGTYAKHKEPVVKPTRSRHH